jgi:hypothetical protein
VREFGFVSGFGGGATTASPNYTKSEDEIMSSFARRIPLLAALIALAACGESATGPEARSEARAALPTQAVSSTAGAERIVEESLYDMSDSYVSIACDDGRESELVVLEGAVYERFTLLYTPADGIRVGYHTMPVGLRGIGAESGEEYRVKEQDHGSFGQTTMGAVGTYRQSFKLVGRTSGQVFELDVKGHYTVNANGQLTVQREKAVTICER